MSLNAEEYFSRLKDAIHFLRDRLGEDPPSMGLVLGSGLGEFVQELRAVQSIPYREIPHFPVSKLVGHCGQLSLGTHKGKRFCALAGRVHLYEGLPAAEIVFAVRVIALWGAETFILTNAAGGINTEFRAGDLMLIKDHINLLGENPLCGPNLDALGERFPDMSEAYSPSLLALAHECGEELGLALKEGIYSALPGPNYETPAEIRMCRLLGADAVGMSTVPEVIALNHMRKKVMGLSCITNMAAGILPKKLHHDEVLQTTQRVKQEFSALLLRIIERLEVND
ncbi:MAG: purine-nucleoside phosphorylase [Acidobacteriota bacterium]